MNVNMEHAPIFGLPLEALYENILTESCFGRRSARLGPVPVPACPREALTTGI